MYSSDQLRALKPQSRKLSHHLTPVLAIATVALAAAVPADGVPPRRAHRAALAPVHKVPVVTAAEYAQSIAPVTCDNAAQTYLNVKPVLLVLNNLINAGAVNNPPKGEYETTQAFTDRSGRYWTNGLGGTTRIVYIRWLSQASVRYDADKSQIVVDRLIPKEIQFSNNYSSRENVSSINLASVSHDRPSYVGQNAYGARVDVNSSVDTSIDLHFPSSQFSGYEPEWSGTIAINADAATAQKFKILPAAIVIADLVSPFFDSAVSMVPATIDAPYEIEQHKLSFSVQMRCVVFAAGDQEVAKILFKE